MSSPEAVSPPEDRPRERFSSRLALLATMIGVAVGLGNVWRCPYMVGRFGGGLAGAAYLSDVGALYLWLRYVIPAVLGTLGVWWLLTEVLGVAG